MNYKENVNELCNTFNIHSSERCNNDCHKILLKSQINYSGEKQKNEESK